MVGNFRFFTDKHGEQIRLDIVNSRAYILVVYILHVSYRTITHL